ncbi:hypothetical protein LTR70_003728 [Exophiala xenobiotica]|uniref:Uncharacterized protein n=1 Tax=Lithohypha guttulata TaxID=1690604 RepID=A0ABR0KI35_9EURO|nr:hypothetical protein LTR24_002312 [Lithohypha guttulata]KAK5322780.1 hypothetical protein LTR70_003728 [Exophiala xenobiotica]
MPVTTSDAAFRESLFDALGDDEGADFWQGVYGQPIHNYSRTYADAETGELETMDDKQYAQYVRRKMWEKSAEGLQAAREERRRERKEEESRRRREQHNEKQKPRKMSHTLDDPIFDFEIEASLRRGQDRKDKRRWQAIWQDYTERWKELQQIYESRKGPSADDGEQIFLRNKIAWPVESGKRKDVEADAIEAFFRKVSDIQQTEHDHAMPLSSVIKVERLKWHPDKIQQRFGFMQVESGTMDGVTAVFQVLDRMWTELRTSHTSKP